MGCPYSRGCLHLELSVIKLKWSSWQADGFDRCGERENQAKLLYFYSDPIYLNASALT